MIRTNEKNKNHNKKGFIGLEYVIVFAILLLASVGQYLNSQTTMKETQKEASIVMSDKEADLFTTNGSTSNDIVSSISLTPDIILLDEIGDKGSSIVKLTPDTSWKVRLNWEAFYNASYTNMTKENSGYKVTVEGLRKGVSKYKVTTKDGSPASKQLTVQTGQPDEYTLSPKNPTIDEDEQIKLSIDSSSDDWSNIEIKEWSIVSGDDIVSLAASSDKKSATISADGVTNGGTAIIKVVIQDHNFDTKTEIFNQIKINKDYFTTFNLNGGKGTFGELKGSAGKEIKLPNNIPTRPGYTYKGWKLSYGSDIYQPGQSYKMPPQNNTMTAQWNANNYDIIFNLNYDGKLHSTASLAYESKLGALPAPTRNGCTFLGWFTAATGGTQITSETRVPLNGATYYAHWSHNEYTISYDVNGGVGTYANQIAKYDSTIQLHSEIPTRAHYTFVGWQNSFDGKTYGAGAQYKIPYQNATMKAVWTAKTYSITYVLNGGAFTSPTSVVTQYKTTDTVILPSVTRTGYSFAGWYGTSGFTDAKVNSIPLGSGGNKTYYAKWNANAYTLSFNANGGSVGTSSKAVSYGSKVSTLPTPSRTGYTFTGWFTATSGGTKWTADTVYAQTSNRTLYAQWQANVYTITFNANGGSVSPSSKTVTYNGTYGTLPTPSRTYYSFNGWYTASSGGSRVTSGTTYTSAGSTTLYAQWTAQYATINLYNDITGATSSHNVQYGTSKNVGGLGAYGYNFKSYTTTNSGIATVSGTTVYAHAAGTVQLRSNWYAQTPNITNGLGNYSGWSGGTRRLQFSNPAGGMNYFILNTGNSGSLPGYSGQGEYPHGWTAGWNDGWHGNSGYIAFKGCGAYNNYDGSNRCSSAALTWIGADTVQPTSGTGLSTYKGSNLNHWWAAYTNGLSGARVAWVDTTVNNWGSGCYDAYTNHLYTQMAISYPTPGGSWVWNATYRVTAFHNGADGNYSWSSGSTIMTRDVESYANFGTNCGNLCGIWQRMIPYSQSGVAAARHTNWC